jgi:hypothetical protein
MASAADEGMPFVDGDLAGEDRRVATVPFLEDFVEVTCGYRKSHPGWRSCRDGLLSSPG